MSKFICMNKSCEKYGITSQDYYRNSYILIDGNLVSNNAPCPCCNKERKEYNEYDEVPLSEKNFSILKFNSCSKEDQRDILKKRSHDHYNKEIKPLKEHRLHETIKAFKETSK